MTQRSTPARKGGAHAGRTLAAEALFSPPGRPPESGPAGAERPDPGAESLDWAAAILAGRALGPDPVGRDASPAGAPGARDVYAPGACCRLLPPGADVAALLAPGRPCCPPRWKTPTSNCSI